MYINVEIGSDILRTPWLTLDWIHHNLFSIVLGTLFVALVKFDCFEEGRRHSEVLVVLIDLREI